MTYARKTLASLRDTPYYHVVARCVRRAWLWGFDEYAGCDYSHRKTWVLERLTLLSSMFAIDICAYAVLSNHYHLVLKVDRERAMTWSHAEVMARWTMLFGTPVLVERWRTGQASTAEAQVALSIIEGWRTRLYDISWFMRCLNQHLAQRANAEDSCTGRFWQGRFRSQALVDQVGLLTAMAYVDLNPVRAGIATTPAESEFTSIYQRIVEMQGTLMAAADAHVPLLAFEAAAGGTTVSAVTLPCCFSDYLALLDWTARAVRTNKHEANDDGLPPIINRLGIDAAAWELAMRPHGNVFGRAMGKLDALQLHARTLGQSWVRGLRQAERMYSR